MRLSKGNGNRVLDGVRGDLPLTIPIPKTLRKSRLIPKRLKFQGLNISIENPAGSMRYGTDQDGHDWSSMLHFDYGYIRSTLGVDGDLVDCFIGPNKDAPKVYVIHQRNTKTGAFDEDKCMLGWLNKADAKRDYLLNYDRKDQYMGCTAMTMDEFKPKVLATRAKPMMIKSKIKAHSRKLKSGKVAQVKEHQDKRTKKVRRAGSVVRDVGEKIGGARKDLWADLATTRITKAMLTEMEKTPLEAHKHIRRKNLLLPLPSEEEAQANKLDPQTYFMLKQVLKYIPERPGDSAAERENYIVAMKRVNGLIRHAKTPEDVVGFMVDESGEMIKNIDKHKANSEHVIGTAVLSGKASEEMLNGLMARDRKERYKQSPFMILARDTALDLLKAARGTASQYGYGGKADLQAFKATAKKMKGQKPKKVSDTMLLGQKWLHFILAGASLSRHYKITKGNESYNITGELRHYDSTRSGSYDLANTIFGGMRKFEYGVERAPVRKGGFHRDVSEKVARRGGKKFKATVPEDLTKEFGIRGVEFGHWIDENSGKHHIQNAGAALYDLATVLGLSSKHMSMKGRLAIGFGARGSGSAAAHYEPIKEVINLTKWNGGGSLAHEWAHFFDNIIAEKVSGRKTDFVSDFVNSKFNTDVPEPIREAYLNVMKAIHLGDGKGNTVVRQINVAASNTNKKRYQAVHDAVKALLPKKSKGDFRDAHKLKAQKVYDKTISILHLQGYARTISDFDSMVNIASHVARITKSDLDIAVKSQIRGSQFAHDSKAMGAYWGAGHEMFARAFESYIEDTLEKNGMRNSYLVSGTKSKDTTYAKVVKGVLTEFNPYPAGRDRIAINKAIAKLMVQVRNNKSLLKSVQTMMIKSRIRILS